MKIARCPTDHGYGWQPPVQITRKLETKGQFGKLFIFLFGKQHKTLAEDWYVELPDGKVAKIPRHFKHDGASFPALLLPLMMAGSAYGVGYLWGHPWWSLFLIMTIGLLRKDLLDPFGRAEESGIVHDVIYRFHELRLDDGTPYMKGCTQREADRLFRELYRHRWRAKKIAWLTWLGMISGSWLAWRGHRENDLKYPEEDII